MRPHHNDTGRLVGEVYLTEVFTGGDQEYLMVLSVGLLRGYGLTWVVPQGGPAIVTLSVPEG